LSNSDNLGGCGNCGGIFIKPPTQIIILFLLYSKLKAGLAITPLAIIG